MAQSVTLRFDRWQ